MNYFIVLAVLPAVAILLGSTWRFYWSVTLAALLFFAVWVFVASIGGCKSFGCADGIVLMFPAALGGLAFAVAWVIKAFILLSSGGEPDSPPDDSSGSGE